MVNQSSQFIWHKNGQNSRYYKFSTDDVTQIKEPTRRRKSWTIKELAECITRRKIKYEISE